MAWKYVAEARGLGIGSEGPWPRILEPPVAAALLSLKARLASQARLTSQTRVLSGRRSLHPLPGLSSYGLHIILAAARLPGPAGPRRARRVWRWNPRDQGGGRPEEPFFNELLLTLTVKRYIYMAFKVVNQGGAWPLWPGRTATKG